MFIKYFWRVRAKDGAGNIGDWSEEWNFTVVPVGAIYHQRRLFNFLSKGGGPAAQGRGYQVGWENRVTFELPTCNKAKAKIRGNQDYFGG
jgi:hypothetical protein